MRPRGCWPGCWRTSRRPPRSCAAEWSEDADGAGRIVLGLDLAALPKRARKTLRRVLHRLRSRGVEVPEAPRPAVVATLPPVDDAAATKGA